MSNQSSPDAPRATRAAAVESLRHWHPTPVLVDDRKRRISAPTWLSVGGVCDPFERWRVLELKSPDGDSRSRGGIQSTGPRPRGATGRPSGVPECVSNRATGLNNADGAFHAHNCPIVGRRRNAKKKGEGWSESTEVVVHSRVDVAILKLKTAHKSEPVSNPDQNRLKASFNTPFLLLLVGQTSRSCDFPWPHSDQSHVLPPSSLKQSLIFKDDPHASHASLTTGTLGCQALFFFF